MNLWCPACRKAWPGERLTCPDCLVSLVADPGATVRCRHCGKDWPATMQSCPNCLAELRPDPAAAVEAIGRILAAGGHLYRPDGVPPFADGPACTLLRLSAQGGLAFVNNDGLVEATVASAGGRAVAPLTCHDHDGTVLFRMVAYEPAERALVAMGTDGAPLATFLADGASIEVRDETSAPAARVVARRGQFELVETGGGALARIGRAEVELDRWIDDQWWLQFEPGAKRLPLRPLAAVALVLAAKVLLGRPAPVRAPTDRTESEDEAQPWSFS